MKFYDLGNLGFVTMPIADILGLSKHHRQTRVLVYARSKAAAFALLGERSMAPGHVGDPNFRVAMGNDVDALAAGGLTEAPAVYALTRLSGIGPVVRIEQDGSPTVVGRLERVGDATLSPIRFVPTPAGVDGPVWTQPQTPAQITALVAAGTKSDFGVADAVQEALLGVADDPTKWDPAAAVVLPGAVNEVLAAAGEHLAQTELSRDDLVARCTANVARVKELTEQLVAARRERLELANLATRCELVAHAAIALGVGAGRVYQLSDEYLVLRANEARAARVVR